METLNALKKFGLTEKEAKVYLASLELGEATASDISIKSKIPRTLVYDLLDKLISEGLETYTIKLNKKHFIASDPQELKNILKEKQEAISEVIPDLSEIQKMKGTKHPKVKIYEGKDGMKTMMNEILAKCGKEFWGFGSSRSSWNIMPEFIEHWHRQRIKNKITLHVIYNNTEESNQRMKELKHTLKCLDFRFLPVNVAAPTATIFYKDKVILQSWTKDPFAVSIESQQMADNYKRYFQQLWKNTVKDS